jgi:hypothetical protein
MNAPGKSLLVPLLCGLVLSPALLLAHEVAHYVAGVWVGCTDLKLHFACVTGNLSGDHLGRRDALMAGAGPLVQATLAVGGFLWLRRARQHHPDGAATLPDWVATMLALNAARGIRGFTGPPNHPEPKDEALVSQALGLPAWFLPYLLAAVSAIALLAIVRLHPPGHRLLPLGSMVLGVLVSGVLWMRLAGPFLLP